MDVDISSYKQPEGKSPLEIASEFGNLHRQGQMIQIGDQVINKNKLDQANQALSYLTRAMTAVGPPKEDGSDDKIKKESYLKAGMDAAKQFNIPPEMQKVWIDKVQSAPSGKAFYDEAVTQLASHSEMIGYHAGQQTTMDDGQQIQPVAVSPKFGIQSRGQPLQKQLPVTQPTVDNDPSSPSYGQPSVLGPQKYVPPANGPLPVGPMPSAGITGPSNNFGGNVTGATVGPPLPATPPTMAQRPTGPVTGLPPGVGEAATATGTASGGHLAQERVKAAAFQRDVFPLAQAIPALEALGTKGTGPGTETINHIKSFVLANVPGVKESDFKGTVKDYDIAKKYLTDFVNQTGSTGTNDKLAAAFAGNPSVNISNAAAVDVAKSALALRRMQQAQYLEFEKTGLPDAQFSKWIAKRTNEIDPRAFGLDLMSKEAKEKLNAQLKGQERKQFENSLRVAQELGFLTPSAK